MSPRLLVAIVVAAAAMVATLPGRTHGLGLVTKPLMADLRIEAVPFAALNFWATIVGAAFCLPVGWLIDRVGVRAVLVVVLIALAATVLTMARLEAGSGWSLLGLVLLTRGLGQSALSVGSLALIGKATGDRPGAVIGVYSFLVAVGFMAAFAGVRSAYTDYHADWRTVWAGIGWALVALAVVAALVVRDPKSESADAITDAARSLTLGTALSSPGFWVFALATSFYGMVAAGMSLFNEALLAERGFDRDVFLTITAVTPLIGLAANLLAGALSTRIRLGILLAVALLIQATALACFPLVKTLPQVYAYAALMGVSGGVLTVVFFTVWRQAFGPAHLGQIQGAAQLLTVLASAVGPLILALGQRSAGTYGPVVQSLAVVAALFAVAAWIVPLPKPNGVNS